MIKRNLEFHENELVYAIHESEDDCHSDNITLFCDLNSCIEVYLMNHPEEETEDIKVTAYLPVKELLIDSRKWIESNKPPDVIFDYSNPNDTR